MIPCHGCGVYRDCAFWSKPDGETELPNPNDAEGAEEGAVQSPPTRKIIKTSCNGAFPTLQLDSTEHILSDLAETDLGVSIFLGISDTPPFLDDDRESERRVPPSQHEDPSVAREEDRTPLAVLSTELRGSRRGSRACCRGRSGPPALPARRVPRDSETPATVAHLESPDRCGPPCSRDR